MNRFSIVSTAIVLVLAGAPVWAQTNGNDGVRAPAGRDRLLGWTPEQMQRAQRVQRPNVDPAAVRAAGRQGDRAGRQDVPGINEAKDLVKDGQRASGNVYERPLYWAGKLFFRAGGEDYVCSAQFISPQILLTAAHCVRDGETGQWNTDFLFALQYREGEFTQLYEYDCVATKNAWLAEGFEKYLHDYAVIRVDKPSRTGFFGTHWGWGGAYDSAVKIGYPGGVANGEVMQVETGPIQFIEGVVQLRHGNPADQGGSSGGAWIARYTDGESSEANYIISVESFGLDGEPGVDYGPYLTTDFKDLWDYGENGCQ